MILAPVTAKTSAMFRFFLPVLLVVTVPALRAAETFEEAGKAAHAMLTRLCDDFGGRAAGTAANDRALDRLTDELRQLGLRPEREWFALPGWERGEDRVTLLVPVARPLRVAALAYSQPHAAFEAEVVSVGDGSSAEYPAEAQGKVALLASGTALPMREISRIAVAHGVRGLLLTNREGGGQLLARTGSFIGENLAVPAYSLTREEGLWLQRLLARGQRVRLRMETRSHSQPARVANLRVVLPGKSPERIIVGAHFDSWDLGQGAVDNGLGIAQLYALARVLREHSLARTVELHWYNAEELGLWGSHHAASLLGDMPVVAMINLDMVGVPIAVNALGDASLVPALERWNAGRGERRLSHGVENTNWLGSDHTSYQLAGVRALTFNAPIPRESVRYYHDFGDTIDKLPAQIVVDSTAIIGDLVVALADDRNLAAYRRTPEETQKLFTGSGLDQKLRELGLWPFAAPATASP